MAADLGAGRDGAGRFQPGQSGNPGGRAGTGGLVVERLRGRRVRKALGLLLAALSGQVVVIVIDARELVGELREQLGGALADDAPPAGAPSFSAERRAMVEAVRARGRARDEALAALQAEGWRLEEHPSGQRGEGPITVWRGPGGEVVGFLRWHAMVEARTEALLPTA